MFNILAGLLAFFYDNVVQDYAASIALLTITVMLVLSPLTWKGTRSMLAMQRLQPEIKRLQAKHKDDRQALNEAMMAFYKDHKVNPLSGCLPQLVQFPVLIVMFRVIRGLTHTAGPQYVDKGTQLFQALKDAGGHMVSLGVDFSQRAGATKGSDAIPLYILIAMVVATSFWQSRQMMARNPAAAQANPQMQMMQKFFPLLSGLISFNLPGGVVLYFLVSNLFRIAQQTLMYRLDPSLTAEVKKEVKEIDAKADEIERKHRSGDSTAERGNGSRPAGPSRNGNGGGRQNQGSSNRRSRKRRSRRR
ncbi:MAG: YidC/Oxa1 family membrane protein insertase [Actinobacteria bacterium]|nr:YidC/Oxa1 family membrane protein insertase [Actinomycetota bacterium]